MESGSSEFVRAGVGRDRYDLSEEVICTIDPVDAKDYDDAISLRRTEDECCGMPGPDPAANPQHD